MYIALCFVNKVINYWTSSTDRPPILGRPAGHTSDRSAGLSLHHTNLTLLSTLLVNQPSYITWAFLFNTTEKFEQISVCVRFVTIGYMPVGHARYIWRHPSSQGAWVIRVIYQLLKTKISYSVKAIRSTDATINHFIQQCRHGWVLPLEQWVTLSPPWCGLLQKQ